MRPRPGRAAASLSPPPPAPSLLGSTGPVKKTLAAKLEVFGKLTDKFLLENGGPLAGNAMLASDPGRAGIFARERFRTHAEKGNIGAQSPLLDAPAPPAGPFIEAGLQIAGEGKGQVSNIAFLPVDFFCGIIEIGVGW